MDLGYPPPTVPGSALVDPEPDGGRVSREPPVLGGGAGWGDLSSGSPLAQERAPGGPGVLRAKTSTSEVP